MLTLETLLKAMRQQRIYGESGGGSCFGVTDPSRLRPPTTPGPVVGAKRKRGKRGERVVRVKIDLEKL